MGTECSICGRAEVITSSLGICLDCIRDRREEALPYISEAHAEARRGYPLPEEPPRSSEGVECGLCSNQCRMGEGDNGYCGLRWNHDGIKSRVSSERGLLRAYRDPHPTNCCSAWFCPACTEAGYPEHTHSRGVEHGYMNLAIFLYGCNFDCLYCQNAGHKRFQNVKPTSLDSLLDRIEADERITCICFFGGSPEPQLPYTLRLSEEALDRAGDRILRICYEWNGCGDPGLVKRAGELSLRSGGNIKFDLKAYNPTLSQALSGVSNRRAYENFRMLAEELYHDRPGSPLLTATTLLVPGYVDALEVEGIARFIADLDPGIPYSLLLFHPDHLMMDLPTTSLRQAGECYRAASDHLDRVHVGNLHLLGLRSMEDFTERM
ncbi:MAG: radical SAM protein [Candidatus Bathyarchaeia archaeon]